ncbi:MAG TPA: PEP-CTERM sorting domain-containing protein [Chthoniobacterales bacterium]|nr:PEP-CTERM sorting domain-containing protein [Chthoniobacterales bacterium]
MKKLTLIITAIAGLLTSTGWAQGAFSVSPRQGGGMIHPIGPASDEPAGAPQPGPGVTAAVPEPSTFWLLAGGALLGSWFVLRRASVIFTFLRPKRSHIAI